MKRILLLIFLLYAISVNASDAIMGVSGAADVILGTGNSDIQLHEVFEFDNIAATSSDLKLNKTGTNAWVEWGDGTVEQVSKTEYTSHTYASAFTGHVRIWSDDNNPITQFYSNDNKYSFDLADFPVNVTDIAISGYNTISGNVADFPVNVTYIAIYGYNTIAGNVADFPVNVTYIAISGYNTITDYTAGRVWANNQQKIYLAPAAGSGLDATEVDNLLIDLANVATWGGVKEVWLAGNNAARTAASDAAVATLIGKGVSVTVNE